MKIEFIEIDYFMSFGPNNRIELSDRGLCLINGINEASETASSNGAGKTALQEALLWGLFGQTTKGVAADEVVNNQHKKDCRVRICLSDDECWYEIHRHRAHSIHGDELHFTRTKGETTPLERLEGVDKAATQARINQLLGVECTLFCNSTYFSQGNVKPFSTYTDKQIKEVLVDALDMSRFTQGQERIRADLKTLREEKSTIEGKQARLTEEIAEAEARKKEYQARHERFASDIEAIIKGIDAKREEIAHQIKDIKAKATPLGTIKEGIDSYKEALAELATYAAKDRDTKGESASFIKIYNQLEFAADKLGRELAASSAERARIDSRVGTACRECGKIISKIDLADVAAGVEKRIKDAKVLLDGKKQLLEKAGPKLVEIQKKAELAAEREAAARDKEARMNGLQVALANIQSEQKQLIMLEGVDKELVQERAEKKQEMSPWAAFVEKETDLIQTAGEKRGLLNSALTGKNKEINYLEYLEHAFGYSGIPSFLLDVVTPFLNERANHYSSVISGGEIEIVFSTVSRTKKGALRDKFSIEITHKNGAKTYRGTSGGERKRADICIAQAIQDLVRSFGRNTLAYCSYDEPFEDLDEDGISYLIEMLNEISGKIGTALVVTHNDALKSMFSNVITVVKGKDGYSKIAA